jgi:hypothetical protein
VLEIISGNQEDRRIIPEALIENDDVSCLEHQLELEVAPGLEKNESQDVLDAISDCIRSLLKISILIRKATPRDRFARALQGDNPFIDQFDVNHVAERYPKLNKPDSDWLCARLGRAITKRRQFLRYSQEHGSRIAGPNGNDRERSISNILSKDNGSVAAHTHTSTKASTLNVTMLQQLREDDANTEDDRSFTSIGSSLQVENENSGLHLPSLKELSSGNSIFECPFCLGIQKFTRESEWRRHAYKDLKAYVCTLGKGKCDSEMFGDSRTWFDHELQCHRMQWMCVLCAKGGFRTSADFESHMKDKHTDVLINDSQLEIFKGAGQRAVDAIAADDCPFCDEWGATLKNNTPAPKSTESSEVVIMVEPIQFRRHVAAHMEQLALFAIPRSTGDDEPEDGTNKVAALSRSTVSVNLQPPVAEISDTDDEWIPDPPLHIAVASGDLARCQVLLEEGADIHSRGETWGTVFDAAFSCHEPTRVDILSLLHSRTEYGGWPNILMSTGISQHPSYLGVKTESQDTTDDPHLDLLVSTGVEEVKKVTSTGKSSISQRGNSQSAIDTDRFPTQKQKVLGKSSGRGRYRCKYFFTHDCQNWVYGKHSNCATCSVS